MPWTNKSKTDQGIEEGKILTPDGQEILVGSSETEVLLYQEEYDNWTRKTKTTSDSWSYKSKIEA